MAYGEERTRWKVLGERLVDESPRLRLSKATVELPDGTVFDQYVMRTPRGAMTVVLDEDTERVLLIWRHRLSSASSTSCWPAAAPGRDARDHRGRFQVVIPAPCCLTGPASPVGHPEPPRSQARNRRNVTTRRFCPYQCHIATVPAAPPPLPARLIQGHLGPQGPVALLS